MGAAKSALGAWEGLVRDIVPHVSTSHDGESWPPTCTPIYIRCPADCNHLGTYTVKLNLVDDSVRLRELTVFARGVHTGVCLPIFDVREAWVCFAELALTARAVDPARIEGGSAACENAYTASPAAQYARATPELGRAVLHLRGSLPNRADVVQLITTDVAQCAQAQAARTRCRALAESGVRLGTLGGGAVEFWTPEPRVQHATTASLRGDRASPVPCVRLVAPLRQLGAGAAVPAGSEYEDAAFDPRGTLTVHNGATGATVVLLVPTSPARALAVCPRPAGGARVLALRADAARVLAAFPARPLTLVEDEAALRNWPDDWHVCAACDLAEYGAACVCCARVDVALALYGDVGTLVLPPDARAPLPPLAALFVHALVDIA